MQTARSIIEKNLDRHMNEIGFKAGHRELFIKQTLDQLKAAVVKRVGERVPLRDKYENFQEDPDTGDDGIMTHLDGSILDGERVASVANFATDKSINDILDGMDEIFEKGNL